uniref:Ig-like domain-containing protein n=1 Tax=Sinocyclocheilus rhinocerous TaxID=307959 RepID=A0A673MA71_9TELE
MLLQYIISGCCVVSSLQKAGMDQNLFGGAPRVFTRTCTVTEGKHAKLSCFVTGHPKPQIIWRKDGVNISEGRRHVMYEDQAENFILKVLYCKQSDNGLYTCNASNLAGQTYSAVLVIVKVFGLLCLGLLLYTWSFPNDKPSSKQKWPDVKPPFWFTKSCISQRISYILLRLAGKTNTKVSTIMTMLKYGWP